MDCFPVYENATKIARLNSKEIKVHALRTGTVAAKTNPRRKEGLGGLDWIPGS